MDDLFKLKKRFLNGEITASQYEKFVSDLEKEKKDKKIQTPNKDIASNLNTEEDRSYLVVVAVFIALSCLLIFIYGSSNPNHVTQDNLVNITDTSIEEKELQKAKEDSIYKIESEKRRKIELAEEAAFMKTKAGQIYKKHPEWSKEDCENLAKGKIWIGMDIEMLKYKRGLPNSANPSNYGGGVTQWQWCWEDWTPSCFYDDNGDGKIDAYN